MQDENQPRLFGVKHSNRDFTLENSWGKNNFNSSFPASLCCYLHSKEINANYLAIKNKSFSNSEISITDVFGLCPHDDDIFFAFEAAHSPFQKYVIGTLPRTDLVIQKRSTGQCLSGLEIKLTALPDNSTCELSEGNYGSEIVVRPDTIAYLACSIAKGLGANLGGLIPGLVIKDWSDARSVLPHIKTIVNSLKRVSVTLEESQRPFLLQPIWKTQGKSPQLAENCLDVFVWSDAGFVHFISEIAGSDTEAIKITRQIRTAVWLFKMLSDIKANGRFNHHEIIDGLSYNTKNDKAFASNGKVTSKFMTCQRLEKPIITSGEIKKIILGDGQHLLSPERRFDAILYNSPELFI